MSFGKAGAGTVIGGREGKRTRGRGRGRAPAQRREYLKVRNRKGVQWAEIAGKLDRSSHVIKFGEFVLMTKEQKSNSRQELKKYTN